MSPGVFLKLNKSLTQINYMQTILRQNIFYIPKRARQKKLWYLLLICIFIFVLLVTCTALFNKYMLHILVKLSGSCMNDINLINTSYQISGINVLGNPIYFKKKKFGAFG